MNAEYILHLKPPNANPGNTAKAAIKKQRKVPVRLDFNLPGFVLADTL
jgi:hypothetical protein